MNTPIPKTELLELLEIAKEMMNFQGKTVWNQALKESGMFQDDFMMRCCNPIVIKQLLEEVIESREVIETNCYCNESYYRDTEPCQLCAHLKKFVGTDEKQKKKEDQ